MIMRNTSAWAQVPGQFGYKYSKNITIYSVSSLDSEAGTIINMETKGPYVYSIDRGFVNPTYDIHKNLVNYTMEHNYTLQDSASNSAGDPSSEKINHVNFAGLSAWYQMNQGVPKFWKSW